MNLKLRVWRQASPTSRGRFVDYEAGGITPGMSFLEMLDAVNEDIVRRGQDPIAFEHDCREGICGSCGMMINGMAHGPRRETTTCQLHMREFSDGQRITIEPWRSRAFPVLKDLIVDRSALDRIVQAGGFISIATGNAPEANLIPVPKADAELAMDAAQCIGCGACVAQCPNGAAQLFAAAKIAHLGLMPQGQPERSRRVEGMVLAMDSEMFGACSNHGECEAVCPKGISVDFIARMNLDFIRAKLLGRKRLPPRRRAG